MAAVTPDNSPLIAISHWRTGTWPILIALMLKTQSLRKLDRVPAADDRDTRAAGDETPHASHGGPVR
jgi:hypothetical protein